MTWRERIVLALAIGGGGLGARVSSAVFLRVWHGVPDDGAILGATVAWTALAASIPFMAVVAERFPASCRPVWRNVLRHTLFAILITGLVTLAVQCFGLMVWPYTLGLFVRHLVWMIALSLPVDGFLYLTVLGIVWAVQTHRELATTAAERIRIERNVAAATAATLERRLQPALIIAVLERAVALAGESAVASERLLLRLARHVRLLLRTSAEETPSFGDELRVAASAVSLHGRGCSLTSRVSGNPPAASHVLSAIVAALDGEENVAITIETSETHLRIVAPEAFLRKLEAGWGIGRDAVLAPPAVPGEPAQAAATPSRTLDRLLLFGVPLYLLAAFVAEVHIQAPLRMGDPAVLTEVRGWTFLLWIVAAPLLALASTCLATLRLTRALPLLALLAAGGAASIAVAALSLHDDGFTADQVFSIGLPILGLRQLVLAGGLCALVFSIAYTRQLVQARLRNARLANALTIAEAQAIESKLHPHFLFNALNSIVALLRDRPDTAREMTSRLAHFLRLAVRTAGRQEWSLDEERDAIEAYLFIQRLRHGDRLRTRWEIASCASAALLPRLLLQPLVENAVKHGVSRLAEGASVVVSIARKRQRLIVRVENDTTAGSSPRVSFGHGLRYVTSRLASLYGSDARLQVARDGARFVVSCRFPYQTAKEIV